MIDSHCHLADAMHAHDLDAVLERAKNAGVDRCIVVADTIPEAEKCVLLAKRYAPLYATVGIHPHAAKSWNDESEAMLRELSASSAKVVAIGEIGLDYHYDHSPRDIQRDVFGTQLELAKDLKLPAVVHCREAVEDVSAILREVKPPKAVIHCCTEKWEDVEPLVAQGYLLSFTGIASYPTATDVRRTIELCPLESMMIETDSPYLTPVPYRGQRNEPAYVVEIAKLIAKIKNVSLAEVDHVTTENTVAFFGLDTL